MTKTITLAFLGVIICSTVSVAQSDGKFVGRLAFKPNGCQNLGLCTDCERL